jgi:hypothetical protein
VFFISLKGNKMRITEQINGYEIYYDIDNNIFKNFKTPQELQNYKNRMIKILNQEIEKNGFDAEKGIYIKIKSKG